jgi:hypothetical protein
LTLTFEREETKMKKFLIFFLLLIATVGILKYGPPSMSDLMKILMLSVVTFLAFLFAAWQIAKHDILFTFVGLNEIKIIVSGEGNPVEVLANLEDYRVENMMIIPGKPKQTWFQKKYGLYFIGFPPRKIHEFEFTHERLNKNLNKNTSSEEWLERDSSPKKTKVLLHVIPHSYLIQDVDFTDNFKADLLFETRSRVVNPLTAVFTLRGNFIDFAKQYVESAVIDILGEMSYEDFRGLDKSDGSDLSKDILEKIFTQVKEAVGLEMFGGFISRFDPNKEQQAALAAQETARLEGEARVESAKKDVEVARERALMTQIDADAQLLAANTIAKGQVAVLTKALEAIREGNPSGLDANIAAQVAGSVAVSTNMSHPKSPVIAIGAGINIGMETPSRREK